VCSREVAANRLSALLVAALLCVSVAACGGASGGSGSAASEANRPDRDNDGDNNDDDAHILNYGRAPTATETQQLKALVTDFYAAQAAANGAKACSMLYPPMVETIPEEYGNNPGIEGSTCAEVLTKLYKREHQTLAHKSATLKFYLLRVKGGEKGLALISFDAPEVRQILERRVNGVWKMAALSDTILE
jgi:hypothetical protein